MSILASADVEDLSSAGLVSPTSSNGTRRIHKRRLNRSSDEENSHLPLTPISSTTSSSVTEMYVTIPELLISLATLEYLGYTDNAANQIWDRWNDWPSTRPGRFGVDPDGEILFIDFAVGYLNRVRDQDTWDENNHLWFNFMNLCGINLEVQTAIMDPIYKRIRLTESCYFWVKDTIELRYRGLEAIQRASRERTMAIERAASRPSHSSSSRHGGSFMGGSSGSAQVTPSQNSGQRSISGTMRMAPGISSDTAFSNACRSAQNVPGSIILYKGLDQALLNGFFNDSGAIGAWQKMFSNPPTDFLGSQAGFYFTVQRDIAEYYACYAKRRDGVQSVVIVQVIVPNHKIERLSTTQLQKTYWPSEEWKNLVWHCRNAKKFPSQLQKFKQALLIIGTIAKKPNRVYNGMNSFAQINERCVLKTKDGHNAVQYVFHDDEGQEFLEELAPGSVTIHPVSTTEFTQWQRDHDFDN
jgi:hypothetical protein